TQRAPLAIRLGDLRLDRYDPLETRLEIVRHRAESYRDRSGGRRLGGRSFCSRSGPVGGSGGTGRFPQQASTSAWIGSPTVAHEVTLIPGDGTGPELTEATRRVLEATGVEFEWDVQQAGADVMDQFGGNPLPEQTLESIRRTGVAIKGPITTPVGGGFRAVNVGLRKAL